MAQKTGRMMTFTTKKPTISITLIITRFDCRKNGDDSAISSTKLLFSIKSATPTIINRKEISTRGNWRILLLFLAFIKFNAKHINAITTIVINTLIALIIVQFLPVNFYSDSKAERRYHVHTRIIDRNRIKISRTNGIYFTF